MNVTQISCSVYNIARIDFQATQIRRALLSSGVKSISILIYDRLLQEQLAEYLDIKSFKRKYPDLTRHSVEIVERDYLVYAHQLNSVMNDYRSLSTLFGSRLKCVCLEMQGLTAIRAIEVHELMSNDYPLLYSVSI